ncbi:MAG: CHAD domain-containing protein [Candidatus Eisenbacteria bacterium]
MEPQTDVTREDRYLDTEDWTLYRAGIALRLRADGRRVRLEAKTLRSRSEEAMVRTEWAQDAPASDVLPRGSEAFEPGPVTALLWPLKGLGIPERLRVVARIRANADSKLASALAAAGLTAPERDERAYAADLGDRLLDVVWKTLARHFGRLAWNEPGTRLGVDLEYLHDMRVASRRLRMALEVFAGAIPEETRTRFAEDLRYIGRALGRVRDLDVGLERVAAMEVEATAEERAALSVFATGLAIRRNEQRVALVEALDSERYAGLMEAAREWIAVGPPRGATVPAGGAPAYHVAPRLVAEAEQALKAAYAEAERTMEPEALHAVRLEAKRLRYTLEFLAPVLGADATARAKRIVALQDFLGAHQDAVTLLARLRKYARTIPRRDKSLTLGAGSAIGVLERAARVKRGALREVWGELEES